MLTHYFDLRIYRAEEKTRGTRRRKPSKRRGVRRAKKKIHSLNTTDEGKMAICFQKNFHKDFYFAFLKKFLAHIAKTESSVVFIE